MAWPVYDPNPNERPDWCRRDGAEKLAESIVDYWTDRGYSIAARVESSGIRAGRYRGAIYAIRSDMIGGMPVRRAG